MSYRFYKPEDKPHAYVKLVLAADDPKLFRRGSAESFSDVDIEALDTLLADTVEAERAKAQNAMKILKKNGKEVREAAEKSLEAIRMEARELYIEMEECYDSGDFARLSEMDRKLSELTGKEEEILRAFSTANPWAKHYADFDWSAPNAMERAVEQITVRGYITDTEWLKNPTYPIDIPYKKGMKNARVDDDSFEWKFYGNGRVRCGLPKYKEPAMDVFVEGAVPKHVAYRDLLPQEWLSGNPHPPEK